MSDIKIQECSVASFTKMGIYVAVVAGLVALFFTPPQIEGKLEVETALGTIRGRVWKSRNGREFLGFTGIPYAKPPLGYLRFEPPVPVACWQGVLEATGSHDVCPQISIYIENNPILGDEDCLYLNVYTPKLPQDKPPYPVMFYIHGGSFIMGSAKPEWLGPELLLDRDVVLVTANYRLGALGFLSTGDDVVPGNNGLKDQALALKWTRDHIANFGGDPGRITVFGNSAGAVSANLHMLSPLSQGFLHGVIAQSGFGVAGYAVGNQKEAKKIAQKLGSYVNCSTASNKELVECLRSVDALTIINQDPKFASWDNDSTIPFKPVVESIHEGAFLTELPADIIAAKKAANVSLMLGIVAQETAYKTADFDKRPQLLEILNKHFNIIVPPTFGITSKPLNSSRAIRKFYFQDKVIDTSMKTELTNLYSDGWFLTNLDKSLQLYFQHSSKPIYQYFFNYRGSTSYTTLFGDPNYNFGVCHTDELLYLFKLGMTFPNYVPTEDDLQMSDVLTTLWTNFATYGAPVPNDTTRWSPVASEDFEFFHIRNATDMGMDRNLYDERVKFWRSLPVGVVFDDE